jgi:alpha-tubulin suppressor-like RCC1 family protein
MRNAIVLLVLLIGGCEFPQPSVGQPCDEGMCATGEVCIENRCKLEQAPCHEAVSAGPQHTCVIRKDHTAWCWGRNTDGQLGNGTTVDSESPVRVAGAFLAIAAGGRHTCAIADDRERSVWCWGSNAEKQVAPVATGRILEPTRLPDLKGTSAIASGDAHSCAVLDDGAVACWGAFDSEQRGNEDDRAFRVDVLTANGPLRGAIDVVAGFDTSCAIVQESTGGPRALWCWGDDARNQIGGGGDQRLAVSVMMPGEVVQAALGDISLCALTSSGDVYCRGDNTYGQRGSLVDSTQLPAKVAMPVPADSIVAGARFACATERREPHRMWCWGENAELQLSGVEEANPLPVVVRYTNVASAAAGRDHLCALSITGGVVCSGSNGHGELGDGNRTTHGTPPSPIAGLVGVVSIAAGERHSCAVAGDKVWCWGDNDFGQLGNGSLKAQSRPVPVEGVDGAQTVVVGSLHSCALLRKDRTAMCWGNNARGQLGNGTASQRRVPPGLVMDGSVALSNIAQLVAGAEHTCALLAGGSVKCWGFNLAGQVGSATCPPQGCGTLHTVPLADVRELALGGEHSCALVGDKMKCWGDNEFGQLGAGMGPDSIPPVMVNTRPGGDLTGVTRIAAGDHFTCAIVDSGAVCWGNGKLGQLGNGVSDYQPFADAAVTGVAGPTSIFAGGDHACVLGTMDLQCWGSGVHGQIGENTYDYPVPATKISLPRAVAEIAGGEEHTCARLDDGTVTCWGDGRRGQLGTGEIDKRDLVEPRLSCP